MWALLMSTLAFEDHVKLGVYGAIDNLLRKVPN